MEKKQPVFSRKCGSGSGVALFDMSNGNGTYRRANLQLSSRDREGNFGDQNLYAFPEQLLHLAAGAATAYVWSILHPLESDKRVAEPSSNNKEDGFGDDEIPF